MRRIIEAPPEEYKLRCTKCGALFAYTLEDVRHDWVACPACNNDNYHGARLWTRNR